MSPRAPTRPMVRWQEELAPLAMLFALGLAIQLRVPSFATVDNLRNVITREVPLTLIAIGQTLVIISGQIDLSVGSVMALSAVTAALLLKAGVGLVLAVLAALAVGTLCGVVNGLVTTRARIPSFVVTLAMMGLARGLALVLTHGVTVSGAFALRDWVAHGRLFGWPVPVWICAAVALAVALVLRRTVIGRNIYAAGANPTAARLSGVRVERNALLVFAVCGLLVGAAGVVECGRNASAQPTMGQLKELDAIAAVVIGGASLTGGQGSVRGTLVGVAIMAVLRNGCNLLSIPNEWEKVVIGPLIVLAVLYDLRIRERRRRRA